MTFSLLKILRNLPPGSTYEESCSLLPEALSWLTKEQQRLDDMYARQESYAAGLLAAGCDEVGRGPLAGPLAAAAVILPARAWLPGLRDSKQLDEEVREMLVPWIQKVALAWHIVTISVEELLAVDNIRTSSLQAMQRSLDKLFPEPGFVLVDGNATIPTCTQPQRAVVKGDNLIPAIAAASILAKVHRDHIMLEAQQKWPQYNFAKNKGYGTSEHLAALRQYGPCPYHRLNFKGCQPTESRSAVQETLW